MLLIADSGSSKTDWVIIGNGREGEIFQTPGINPFFQKKEEISSMLNSSLLPQITRNVERVFFYGAGCIKGETDGIVADALSGILPMAKIEVEDDLLGSARALFDREEGIACILGTGANTCLFNGEKIVHRIPTLGYILGDEGSGAHIGKQFLNSYFKKTLAPDLMKMADSELDLELPGVLEKVYREKYPNRYLAAFTPFLKKHADHADVKQLIKKSLTEFFIKNVERYPGYKNLPVCFTGSIAHHFHEILNETALERGISIGRILQRPIEGLIDYYAE